MGMQDESVIVGTGTAAMGATYVVGFLPFVPLNLFQIMQFMCLITTWSSHMLRAQFAREQISGVCPVLQALNGTLPTFTVSVVSEFLSAEGVFQLKMLEWRDHVVLFAGLALLRWHFSR